MAHVGFDGVSVDVAEGLAHSSLEAWAPNLGSPRILILLISLA